MVENIGSGRIEKFDRENATGSSVGKVKVPVTTLLSQAGDIKHVGVSWKTAAELQKRLGENSQQVSAITHWTNRINQNSKNCQIDLSYRCYQDHQSGFKIGNKPVFSGA